MTTEELILPYKLEQHLTEICNSSATYKNLLSVWNINKKMCQDVLNTVVMNYPHYTNHDVSHCEAIITNIEMLLVCHSTVYPRWRGEHLISSRIAGPITGLSPLARGTR